MHLYGDARGLILSHHTSEEYNYIKPPQKRLKIERQALKKREGLAKSMIDGFLLREIGISRNCQKIPKKKASAFSL